MGYNGVKESFQKFAVNQALKYLEKNPEGKPAQADGHGGQGYA